MAAPIPYNDSISITDLTPTNLTQIGNTVFVQFNAVKIKVGRGEYFHSKKYEFMHTYFYKKCLEYGGSFYTFPSDENNYGTYTAFNSILTIHLHGYLKLRGDISNVY